MPCTEIYTIKVNIKMFQIYEKVFIYLKIKFLRNKIPKYMLRLKILMRTLRVYIIKNCCIFYINIKKILMFIINFFENI